ncbi:sentrin-specific protease 8-like [Bombus pascuorum]|uniref:sentrin-specific protease 8-like n=1 Tax=Bombus pascuorum TaxID=65598 RepID=UPI00212EAE36|nr:sentrin-specific protease 8-like [Bombus pascuorum]XP_060816850.1 sentrin-specific protease 8-like [Bombus pascuorum]XP_060816858.1 sentrin-specific protease 8-like [Bombus pascuorum]XP_060816859.1 sentrin-specific protease 8-like [Bombus pascuorum]
MATDSSNEIILSYYDCLLRASDVELLQGSHWLNDVIIGFYFEYLDETFNKNEKRDFYFISPELTQLLKMTEPDQYIIFLDPFSISECKCILFPLNNCDKKDTAGGTHWSLLIFCKGDKTCYHFDSAKGYNGSIASQFAENVMSCVLDKNEPNKRFVEVNSPQQDNGYDCGVYVLCLADIITNHILKNENMNGCNYDQVKELVRTKRTDLLNLINDLKRKPLAN